MTTHRTALSNASFAPISFAVALGAVSLAGTARADDLAPPPEDCPPGSVGHTEHAGEWCAATTCTSDDDCTGAGIAAQVSGFWPRDAPPRVCREAALCVVEETYALGGLRPTPAEGRRRVARGACVAGACPAGGECRPARRCVPPDAPVATAPPSPASQSSSGESSSGEGRGGGCVAGTGSHGGGLWILLAIGALFTRRRPLGVTRRRR